MASLGVVPALYAVGALAAGLTFSRTESALFPGLVAAVSVSAATAIYSAIASGMIALTGIVFSLAFVMVQFGAMAYSPRLVGSIARDRVTSHALGTFTATFLFAIAALGGVDRSGSGRVPFVSLWVVVFLLLASVAMFIALIERVGKLQVDRVLTLTGGGRTAIATTYAPFSPAVRTTRTNDFADSDPSQTIVHRGPPRTVQGVDAAALVRVARASGGMLELKVAIGDSVVESMPVVRVFRAARSIDERDVWAGIALGHERTFAQAPSYAIRLLVDIAIRALSPAINDPTTAVQALDQIEDLLIRLSQRDLEIGEFRDSDGRMELLVPCPTWADLLGLAFDEIVACGTTSVQVMRRMNALPSNLASVVPEERRPAVVSWQARLKSTIARSFGDPEEMLEASTEDRQGLGGARSRRTVRSEPANR